MRVDWRYLGVSAVLVAWAATYVADGVWLGDYWNHAAVVRELSTHPFHPTHPLFDLAVPHAFSSPYAWVVAMLARLLGLRPVTALSVAGIGNVLLLLAGLRAFCGAQFGSRGARTAFYAVPLFLFWWGLNPWFWSGFLHLDVFGYVTPYPSTFSLGLTLVAWTLVHRLAVSWSWQRYALIVLALCVIVLTHPTTAIFAALGVLAIGVDRIRGGRHLLWLGMAPVLAVILASTWPLYPFLDLFRTDNREFHIDSAVLYERVWSRTAPVLLAIPVVLWRASRRRADALVTLLLALAVIYCLGYTTRYYGMGRAIAHVALVVHLALAERLAWLEEHLRERRLALLAPYTIALGLLVWFGHDAYDPEARANRRKQDDWSSLSRLSDHVGQYDVVLADLRNSWVIPTFGGKVVAASAPMYWVEDNAQRREDVTRFLASRTSRNERSEILRRYGVRYVLLDRRQSGRVALGDLADLIAENGLLRLYEVAERADPPPP